MHGNDLCQGVNAYVEVLYPSVNLNAVFLTQSNECREVIVINNRIGAALGVGESEIFVIGEFLNVTLESGVAVVKCFNKDEVDANFLIHTDIGFDIFIGVFNRSVPYRSCRDCLALGRGNKNLLAELFDLELAVVVAHQKADSAILGEVGILECDLDVFLNLLERNKLCSYGFNVRGQCSGVDVIKLLHSCFGSGNDCFNVGYQVFIVTVECCRNGIGLCFFVENNGCAKNNVCADEVAALAVTGNNVTALGDLGNVNAKLNNNAVCINGCLIAVNVGTCACCALVAPTVLVDHGLVFTAVCGKFLGGRFHRAGVALFGGVDVIVFANYGAAKANVVEADHSHLVTHGEELIGSEKLTVAGTVGGKHESVIGNGRSGIIARAEGTEADDLERLFFKVILTDDLGAEGVGARLFAKLIIVVNDHGTGTVCVGIVNNDSLLVGFNRLCGDGDLCTAKGNNIANRRKAIVLRGVNGDNKSAYGNVGVTVTRGDDFGYNVLVFAVKLANVLNVRACSARFGIGIPRGVDNRCVFAYVVKLSFIVGKRAARCNLPEYHGVCDCVKCFATNSCRYTLAHVSLIFAFLCCIHYDAALEKDREKQSKNCQSCEMFFHVAS